MKIENVHLKGHPLFDELKIDFTGSDGKPLDIIVVAGLNGSGKTSLLKAIFEIMSDQDFEFEPLSSVELKIQSYAPGFENDKFNVYHRDAVTPYTVWRDKFKSVDEKIRPKLIYMPTEINFEKLSVKTLSFTSAYSFVNVVNQKMIEDIPSFIASEISSEVFKNPELPAKGAIDKVCNEMNSLFDILELDARMVGLNPEGGKLPLFKNSVGKVFDINYLSSGEKQLFARGMALRMLNAVNSVILIDEPEISMHPGWQQKIVKVYRQLANNSQIIIATHSPHIVASVSKESVKLLKREKGRIKIVDSKDINGSYGLPVDVVLKELMELKSLRTPDVDAEIKTLWDLLHREQYLTEEFKQQYLKLEKLLGSEDEELLLMRIEIAKLEAQKGKPNVGSGVIS